VAREGGRNADFAGERERFEKGFLLQGEERESPHSSKPGKI